MKSSFRERIDTEHKRACTWVRGRTSSLRERVGSHQYTGNPYAGYRTASERTQQHGKVLRNADNAISLSYRKHVWLGVENSDEADSLNSSFDIAISESLDCVKTLRLPLKTVLASGTVKFRIVHQCFDVELHVALAVQDVACGHCANRPFSCFKYSRIVLTYVITEPGAGKAQDA